MLSFAVAWLTELPFSVAGLVIERAPTDWPTVVGPYLLPDTHAAGPVLSADAGQLGVLEHVADVPVKVLRTSRYTVQPNAEAPGWGPSRQVML